jgi:hypothetical protein
LKTHFSFQLAEKYLPVQKPEFVNISIPVVDATPKYSELIEDQHNAVEEDYQPITAREEADFMKMLGEFNLGISDATRFHECLTKKLHNLDNTNIESIMASEQAVSKLINDLDECEEKIKWLSIKLEGYDMVLNVSYYYLMNSLSFRPSKKASRSSRKRQIWKWPSARTWNVCWRNWSL